MKVTIHPSRLKGSISAPASKSSMQRACAAALMRQGTTIIHNPGHSNDDKAAIDIIQRLGATVEMEEDRLIVRSGGINPVSNEINCGESGLSIRMFTPLVAASDREIRINGSGSLVTRPMGFFDEVLPLLNVEVISNEGRLPLTIRGPLLPANIEVDGSLSSQFLTGLLMAYGSMRPTGGGNRTIRVKDLKSKPYIDLTLDVMNKFGFNTPENHNHEEFVFNYDSSRNLDAASPVIEYKVEGDWSGGAFLLVAGAIAGPITVRGLDVSSTQADRKIIDALMSAQAGMAIEAKGIVIHPGELRAFEFDATDCPDLFPPLVSLASYCEGNTRIKGVRRLIYKESNRALTLQEEFSRLGVEISFDDDVMTIKGAGILKGEKVHSRHDHRIAMALATAALCADDAVTIQEAGAVSKSYPDFYSDLKHLGAAVTLPFHSFKQDKL